MARSKNSEHTVQLILDISTKLFLNRGYDNTSIQNIITETKLSKGAIYHHFASKEDIFMAVSTRMGEENIKLLSKIRDRKTLNGLEKLQEMFRSAFSSSNNLLLVKTSPNLLENPKFLAIQIRSNYEISAPLFIQPILEEGIQDGSISVENPRELAELMIILIHIWLNPLVYPANTEGMKTRCIVFNNLMSGIGINLLDDSTMENYTKSLPSIIKT